MGSHANLRIGKTFRVLIGFKKKILKYFYWQVASINLFGMIRVIKGFLPLIREANGRVVNVASMLGRMGANGRSPYCATKFGVEAISDCLRLEMKKFNVDVSSAT